MIGRRLPSQISTFYCVKTIAPLCMTNVHFSRKCAAIGNWKKSCPYKFIFTLSQPVLRWESPTIFTVNKICTTKQIRHPNARWVNYSIHLLNDTVTIHHSSISNEKMNHSQLLRKYHQFLQINFHNLYSSLTRWLTATDPFPPPSSTDDTTTIWRNSK